MIPMLADESGIYMICRGQYKDSMNTVVSTASIRDFMALYQDSFDRDASLGTPTRAKIFW
jgi:hypothetical protein